MESELFGHEKGSFTGADQRRIGKFEQCSGGTLFLDEIGDMSPLVQSKVLRVLQSQQFERVGGNHTITTDVRVIAATNRDLEKMVEDGEFRSDLYYRLSGFTIQLAPLRDRPEDLQPLLENYLAIFSKELSKDVHGISPEAMDVFLNYSWPGNVRELQNVLKQTLLRSAGNVIIPDFIPDRVRFPQTVGGTGAGGDEAAPICGTSSTNGSKPIRPICTPKRLNSWSGTSSRASFAYATATNRRRPACSASRAAACAARFVRSRSRSIRSCRSKASRWKCSVVSRSRAVTNGSVPARDSDSNSASSVASIWPELSSLAEFPASSRIWAALAARTPPQPASNPLSACACDRIAAASWHIPRSEVGKHSRGIFEHDPGHLDEEIFVAAETSQCTVDIENRIGGAA